MPLNALAAIVITGVAGLLDFGAVAALFQVDISQTGHDTSNPGKCLQYNKCYWTLGVPG